MAAGADDYAAEGDAWVLTAAPQQFTALRKAIEVAGLPLTSAALVQLPTSSVKVDDADVARRLVAFLEALDDHDDVQNVYSNAEIPDEVLAQLDGG